MTQQLSCGRLSWLFFGGIVLSSSTLGSVGSWNSSVARDPLLRLSLLLSLLPFRFPLSAPHFPFIPFAQCPLVRQSNFLRLNFINSPFGDNDPLCVRLLLWSRVSSALEGDLLPSADPSLSQINAATENRCSSQGERKVLADHSNTYDSRFSTSRCRVQGSAKRWALGCVQSCPAARGSQEAGFT